jgi:endoglucanase
LNTAVKAWDEEHAHPPVIFRSFNTPGGELDDEEVKAAVKLLIATHDSRYQARLGALLPAIEKNFAELGWLAARTVPFMDAGFKQAMGEATSRYETQLAADVGQNPFGVPVRRGTWGGSQAAAAFAAHNYFLHQVFPDRVSADATMRGFTMCSAVTPSRAYRWCPPSAPASKLLAYGNNRADYTFIPGGMVPGVVIIEPDYPELKEAWPFLWYENEYVIDAASVFILAANAAAALSR